MSNIEQFIQIDFKQLFVWLALILLVAKALVDSFSGTIGKWLKSKNIETQAMREKREDHELIRANAQAIKDLAELHKKDNELSNEHDEMIREELHQFMDEVRNDIKTFTDNRVHDREQSREIQKELSDSIKIIAESQKERGKQVEALMCGSKELLGNTIDERYEKYISLKGIPQNEVDEFDSIYEAYTGLHGNHGRQTKYEYVKNHLTVIPVKTELILN